MVMSAEGQESDAGLRDGYDRNITYLRVSVTDRCNMRCVYCMPEGTVFLPHEEILTYDEIERIVRVGIGCGIRKVRLTGGEPLARKNIVYLVERIAALGGLDDLSLTTNGLLLAEHAAPLARAGLKRVNVSLDTLDAVRFREICRAGNIEEVIAGIRAADAAGLRPVKVNVVVMRGRNDTDIRDFVEFSIRENVVVRFIEYMPFNRGEEWKELFVPREESIARISDMIERPEANDADPGSPARYFRIKGAGTSVGFISPITHGFCSMCNRMRLTPDGRLLACLLAPHGTDLKTFVRGGGSDDDIISAFRAAAASKGRKGEFPGAERPMHTIGG